MRVALAAALLSLACSRPKDEPCADRSCDEIRAMRLLSELPPSPGNAHADDLAAATFGFRVFFSASFSAGGQVRCVSCHQPEHGFADPAALSRGVGLGRRNSPTTFNAARLSLFFWDGRADSLWSQPLFAFENPVEMNFTRLQMVHALAASADLSQRYTAAFGPLPDVSALPSAGKPGDPAWDSLPVDDKAVVNRVVTNIGKALDAYLRRNLTGDSPFDAYLDGDGSSFDAVAQRGLRSFVSAGCQGCHSGPNLTDEKFHAVLPPDDSDLGRAEAVSVLSQSEFTRSGPYADAPSPPQELTNAEPHAFRTPSLRNVLRTAPYGHDGRFATLDELLDAHAPNVTGADRDALKVFLASLNGSYPPPPWNDWPVHQ